MMSNIAERLKKVYEKMPIILNYLFVLYGLLRASDIPEVETDKFYNRYGFKILSRNSSNFPITPNQSSIEFWKRHTSKYGDNIRAKRTDKAKTVRKSGRKYIFPESKHKKNMRKTRLRYRKELEYEQSLMNTFMEHLKNLIGLSGQLTYGLWMTLLYSTPLGPVQEFHHDVDSNDPDTYVLWVPFEEDTTIWIIPSSHKHDDQEEVTVGTKRKHRSVFCKPIELLEKGIPVRLHVAQGDILKMHSKLIHAGDIFSKTNIRGHFYVQRVTEFYGNDNLKNIYPDDLFKSEIVLDYLERFYKTYLATAEKKARKARTDEKLKKANEARRAKRLAAKECDCV